MDDRPSKATPSETLQILITEHNNLQAVRSGTIFEANGRTTLFLGAVSSSVVALAFIGQISEMSEAFSLFALILLPCLIFLGIVTFVRVYQTGLEDMVAARGINRIRHYYAEFAPETKNYFILSTHDDMAGMLQNMGVIGPDWLQLFMSTHGLVSVINSVLAAVFAGLMVTTFLDAALLVCSIVGFVIFVLFAFLHFTYQSRAFDIAEAQLRVLFPSDQKDKT
jgi:hypothetical protein